MRRALSIARHSKSARCSYYDGGIGAKGDLDRRQDKSYDFGLLPPIRCSSTSAHRSGGMYTSTTLSGGRDILRYTKKVRFPTLNSLSLNLITPESELYHATYRELDANEALPWWGFLWPGGYGMARHLVANPDLVKGRKVLDFACGNGAASILALASGADFVMANDICPIACASAHLNLKMNVEACKWSDCDIDSLSHSPSSLAGQTEFSEPDKSCSEIQKIDMPIDWEHRFELAPHDLIGEDLHADRFDVVIAGDILYDDEIARQVFPWLQSQAQKGIEVLIGDPGRWVLKEMAERGERDSLLEHVASYELDDYTRKEHSGLHTGSVWRVLATCK